MGGTIFLRNRQYMPSCLVLSIYIEKLGVLEYILNWPLPTNSFVLFDNKISSKIIRGFFHVDIKNGTQCGS